MYFGCLRFIRYLFLVKLCSVCVGASLCTPSSTELDLKRFDAKIYDSVFVSMYTTEGFLESEYEKFRGMHLYKNMFQAEDENTFRLYLDHILTSSEDVQCLYLGVLPDEVGADVIADYAKRYPERNFEILPAYYEISVWQELEAVNRSKRLKAYYELCRLSVLFDNVNVYSYFAAEWLITNPMNYQEGLLLDPGVASTVMLTADYLHDYLVTEENLESVFIGLEKLIGAWNTGDYPDLSGWNLVFLGDSVFGNYRDGSSIAHVIEGLTGADTFNFAIGGTVSVPLESNDFHLGRMVDRLQDRSYCAGSEQYDLRFNQILEDVNLELERFFDRKEESPTVFFLHYGFNEYILNIPVEDTADQIGYKSAMKKQILRLQGLYPDAEIVVLVPNRITDFQFGTKINGENPCVLEDYVSAILQMDVMEGVTVINNYDVFLDEQGEVQEDCMDDGLHPSVKGRCLLGRHIAERLASFLRH